MTGNSPQMPTIAEGEIEGEYPHETEPVTDRERIAEENEERGVTMFDQKHDELMNINMQPDIDQTDGNYTLFYTAPGMGSFSGEGAQAWRFKSI